MFQVPSHELENRTLTGSLETMKEGLKVYAGWFSKNLSKDVLTDDQGLRVSWIGLESWVAFLSSLATAKPIKALAHTNYSKPAN